MNKVVKVSSKEQANCFDFFISSEWKRIEDSNQYVVWRLKGKGVIAIAYSSGKILFQGSDTSSDWILVEECLSSVLSKEKFQNHIGVDEAGKGDYFGPLVTAAAFVEEKNLEKLKGLGIMDSKKITDKKIAKIFDEIKDSLLFDVSILMPEEFNLLYKQYQNINKLLASQHSLVIENLLTKLDSLGRDCDYVLIDQFSKNPMRVKGVLGVKGRDVEFRQMHGGEADIAVAMASIVARYHFVQSMDKLSEKWNIEFPKGATDVVNVGKEFVAKYGVNNLTKVAKVNFKTTEQVVKLF